MAAVDDGVAFALGLVLFDDFGGARDRVELVERLDAVVVGWSDERALLALFNAVLGQAYIAGAKWKHALDFLCAHVLGLE